MPGNQYLALGYPASRTRNLWASQIIDGQCHAQITHTVEPAEHLPFHPDLHLALHYDREDGIRVPDGRKVSSPTLPGQSGGGIWRIHRPLTRAGYSDLAEPKLVGIITEWHPKEVTLIGTQFRYALGLMRASYPELAEEIDRFQDNEIDAVRTGTIPQPMPVRSVAVPRIGRNDPCYCGSGRKYKKCHGA